MTAHDHNPVIGPKLLLGLKILKTDMENLATANCNQRQIPSLLLRTMHMG